MPSLAQLMVWIVMGLAGGSLAGLIITRERKGFGLVEYGTGPSPELSSAACCSACWGFSLALIRSRYRCVMSWPPSLDRSLSSRRFGSGSVS